MSQDYSPGSPGGSILPTPSGSAGAFPTRAPLYDAGGWCAPPTFDFPRVAPIAGRVTYPATPPLPPAPPTRRERVRQLQRRLSAARIAARKAWQNPDGWWEVD